MSCGKRLRQRIGISEYCRHLETAQTTAGSFHSTSAPPISRLYCFPGIPFVPEKTALLSGRAGEAERLSKRFGAAWRWHGELGPTLRNEEPFCGPGAHVQRTSIQRTIPASNATIAHTRRHLIQLRESVPTAERELSNNEDMMKCVRGLELTLWMWQGTKSLERERP